MTDKFTTGRQRMAGASASSADPMNAPAPEEPGHHGRAAGATSHPITRWERCNACRERATCRIDAFGYWLCPQCASCFDDA